MSSTAIPFDEASVAAFALGRKTRHREPVSDAEGLSPGDRLHVPLPDGTAVELVVTGVRTERLHDVTEAEAEAEGPAFDVWDMALAVRDYSRPDGWFCMWGTMEGMPGYVDEDEIWRASFRTLWEGRHGPGSWDANPLVRVTAFEAAQARPDGTSPP